MALTEKITQEDLYLYEIVKNPVLFGEFINNIDKLPHEEGFEFDPYQKEMLCDFNPYVVFSCARAVGKTVSLANLILWLMINNIFPGEYINYHVPGKSHVEPVFTSLVNLLRTNSFLKHFISPRKGVNHSDLIIKLNNATRLLCRIAGQTGTGAPVIGLHTPFSMVDEGGYYPWGTWVELQPTMNTFTPGFRLIVSGVPTGLRENNVLYHADKENSAYTKHNISAYQNPRFSEEDKQRAIEMYGGEESEDYIHLVLGEHGKPIFALFDRSLMEIKTYPVYKLVLDGAKMYENIANYEAKLLTLPGLPDRDSNCIFGIDLGYTEPTAIVIMYLDRMNRLKFHSRIRLNKVNYFIQEKIIDWLDTKFRPSIIGIDQGHSGKAVVPRLRESEEFLHKNYIKRIIPVEFGSQIVLGTDSDGNEIKSKTKPFSVGILQEYSNNHKIVYSSTDLEMVTELERMTYSRTPTGDIVYKTLTLLGGKRGEDHFTSALLCGSLAYYLENESLDFRPVKRKLARSSWLV
jgi:hypothetical protein